MIQVITKSIPYPKLLNDAQVIVAVLADRRPVGPDLIHSEDELSRTLYVIAEACWRRSPAERTSLQEVTPQLESLRRRFGSARSQESTALC